jgi:hypothetical protein
MKFAAVNTTITLLLIGTAPTAFAAEETTSATSIFFDLGKAAAGQAGKEAGGQVGKAFAGLALHKIGIGNKQKSPLDTITGELSEIEDTLNDILDELICLSK